MSGRTGWTIDVGWGTDSNQGGFNPGFSLGLLPDVWRDSWGDDGAWGMFPSGGPFGPGGPVSTASPGTVNIPDIRVGGHTSSNWPDWAGDIVGAGIGLLGAAGGAASQSATNKAQIRAAERMYRNRYQWQTQDMIAAGLNPILGVGTAPVGSMPNLQAAFDARSTEGVASSARSFSRRMAELKILNEQKEAIYRGAERDRTQAEVNESMRKLVEAQERTEGFRAMATAQDIGVKISEVQRNLSEAAFKRSEQKWAPGARFPGVTLPRGLFEFWDESMRNSAKDSSP